MDLNQKTEFSTADFVGLMPNIEHALELTFAQTIKTKRDGDFHGHLYWSIQEDDCMFLSLLEFGDWLMFFTDVEPVKSVL